MNEHSLNSSACMNDGEWDVSHPTVTMPAPGTLGTLYLGFETDFVRDRLSKSVSNIVLNGNNTNFIADNDLQSGHLWWAKAAADNSKLVIINTDCNVLEMQLALTSFEKDKRLVVFILETEDVNSDAYNIAALADLGGHIVSNLEDLSDTLAAYYTF